MIYLRRQNMENIVKNIKELEIDAPFIPMNYTKYLTKYMTQHLEKLKIDLQSMDLSLGLMKFGYYTALDLIGSLHNINSGHINWSQDRRIKRRRIDKESNMTTFYSLLHLVKGDKKMFCIAQLGDFWSTHQSIKFSHQYGLHFLYLLSKCDYSITSNEDSNGDNDRTSSSQVGEITLPDCSKSSIGPEIIHHMEVKMFDKNPDLPLRFLTYALENCPELQYFSYGLQEYPRYGIYLGLDIDRSNMKSKRRAYPITCIKKNIEVLKTRNMFPSKELLETIHAYVPTIESFVFTSLDYSSNVPTETIFMDLRGLKNLSSVQFDADLLVDHDLLFDHRSNTRFIELQFSDGDSEYYFLEITAIFSSLTKNSLRRIMKMHENVGRTVIQHKHVKFFFSSDIASFIEVFGGELSDVEQRKAFILHSRSAIM